MREKILEALELAKKFYSEQLGGNYDHQEAELIRFYQLEGDIVEEYPNSMAYQGWYGAICELKDLLRFEF